MKVLAIGLLLVSAAGAVDDSLEDAMRALDKADRPTLMVIAYNCGQLQGTKDEDSWPCPVVKRAVNIWIAAQNQKERRERAR